MATAKPAPTPPPKARSGAKFVKAQGGSAVRPTSAAGKKIGVATCASRRKHFYPGSYG